MATMKPSARALAREVKNLTWELERAKKEKADLSRTVRALHAQVEVLRKFDGHAYAVLSEVRTFSQALWRASKDLEEEATKIRQEAINANLSVQYSNDGGAT